MFATVPFPFLIPFHVRLVFVCERLPHFVFRGAFRLSRLHQRQNEGRPGTTVDPSWTPLHDPAVTFGRRDMASLHLGACYIWAPLHLALATCCPRYIWAPIHLGLVTCRGRQIWTPLHFGAVTFGSRYIWAPLHLGAVTFGPRCIWAPLHLALVTFRRRYMWPSLHLAPVTFGRRYIWLSLHLGTATCGPRYIWPSLHLGAVTFGLRYMWASSDLGAVTLLPGKPCSRLGGNTIFEFGEAARGTPEMRGFGENRALA